MQHNTLTIFRENLGVIGLDAIGEREQIPVITPGYFSLNNRRYLGNKYKLLSFIKETVDSETNRDYESFCDIFAGTGSVGAMFNSSRTRVISNDILHSNYVSLRSFLAAENLDNRAIADKINYLNELSPRENYFSLTFGGTFFSKDNAAKIGTIREEIDVISDTEDEKMSLLTSLVYATDKVANTVGHYDAFRKKLTETKPVKLRVPLVETDKNINNEVYMEDANQLIKKISCDILYLDPPYNSRQYSDAYHLLDNLTRWEKPAVKGVAKKMDRTHIKSEYCLKGALRAFQELIENARAKHIFFSYNNTAETKDGRSNARISDKEIIDVLGTRGDVKVFSQDHKGFTTGKSDYLGNMERIFYCRVSK